MFRIFDGFQNWLVMYNYTYGTVDFRHLGIGPQMREEIDSAYFVLIESSIIALVLFEHVLG